MFLSAVSWPVISIILLLWFSRILGNKGTAILSTFFLGLNCIIVFFCALELVSQNGFIFFNLLDWITILGISVSWAFYLDTLNISILLMVNFVSFFIRLYSIEYFSSDPHQARFMIYLSSFTSSMILLISSNNLFQFFLGWEFIGLFSYLLINFWFTWVEANKSSIKAMLINRIGDLFLSLFFFFLFYFFKSIDLNLIFGLSSEMIHIYTKLGGLYLNLPDVLTFFLFFGIAAKSAQVPFRTWLVNAMAAPSPVSALIRAATLVTSGVFLIIKFSFILEHSYNLVFLSIFGIFTSLFSGITAIVQNDSKRIIAYSTCSQLGYMVFSAGISQYKLSFFHLLNRGCFKALLFLGMGSLIRSLNNKQDIRALGSLLISLPANYAMFVIGSLTLAGFPFLSGFFSKDMIIEFSFANFSFYGFSIYFFSVFIAILTTIYSTRLVFFVYLKKTNLNLRLYGQRKESGLFISAALSGLTLLSIFAGYAFSDLFAGLGSDFLVNSVSMKSEHFLVLNAEFENQLIKNIPFFFTIFGIFFSLAALEGLKSKMIKKKSVEFEILSLLQNRWFFDFIQNRLSRKSLEISRKITFKLIDQGMLENIGPTSLLDFFKSITLRISANNTGFLFHYLLAILASWLLFLSYALSQFSTKLIFICLISFFIF